MSIQTAGLTFTLKGNLVKKKFEITIKQERLHIGSLSNSGF